MPEMQTAYLYENRKPIRLADVFQNFSSSGAVLIGEKEVILGTNDFFNKCCTSSRPESVADLPEALQTPVRRFLDNPGVPVTEQITLKENAESGRTFQIEIFQAPGGPGSPVSVVLLNDVGSVHALESHIRRLDRLANIGTLSASAAHEIKNCLVTIKTFLDTVLEDSNDEEMAELVKREMNRINSTTSQLLKFSGSPKSEMTSQDVHELLLHSLRLVQHQMAEKHIELVENLEPGNMRISADENLLEQAFINLFLNAIDAVAVRGQIRVATKRTGESDPDNTLAVPAIRIVIEDDGEGIAPENIEHLFRRFFTTKAQGTGLGLAITHQIVKEHGGRISVESQPGKGARFQILLPLR